jgi:hypothetical protein
MGITGIGATLGRTDRTTNRSPCTDDASEHRRKTQAPLGTLNNIRSHART